MFSHLFSLLPYSIGHWFGIATEYFIAAGMVAGGLYVFALFKVADTNPLYRLLGPIRYLGLAIVCCGVALAAVTYGKSLGAGACEAAWRTKNLEAKIAAKDRDIAAFKLAAQLKAKEAQDLAQQKAEADGKISDYQSYADGLSAALHSCRLSSDDDDRRLRDILGQHPTKPRRNPGLRPAARPIPAH